MEVIEKLKYQEFIDFFHLYKGNDNFGSDEELDKKIDWFLANRRFFVIRNKGRILGLCAFMILESPAQIYGNQWPKDNYLGKYLFAAHLSLHPSIRRIGTMNEMVKIAVRIFPNIEYILYRRFNKTKLAKIKNFLKHST